MSIAYESDIILDSILNPAHKDLDSEYKYMLNYILSRLNMNNRTNAHVRNINHIRSTIETLNGSKEKRNSYLLQVLPYMSDLCNRLNYIGT